MQTRKIQADLYKQTGRFYKDWIKTTLALRYICKIFFCKEVLDLTVLHCCHLRRFTNISKTFLKNCKIRTAKFCGCYFCIYRSIFMEKHLSKTTSARL